jgi:hypothetical protein
VLLRSPTAAEPCFTASQAYSTWWMRPCGDQVVVSLSYWFRNYKRAKRSKVSGEHTQKSTRGPLPQFPEAEASLSARGKPAHADMRWTKPAMSPLRQQLSGALAVACGQVFLGPRPLRPTAPRRPQTSRTSMGRSERRR